MSLIAIAMNTLLAGLLTAALGLGWRLDRRLRAVRDGQAAFAKAVTELNSAAGRAQAGLAELRAATDEAIDLLGGRIVRAREAGDRLDEALARAAAAPLTPPAAAVCAELFDADPQPRGLDALLARLEGSQVTRPSPRTEPRRAPVRAAVDDDLFADGGLA